MAKQTRKKIEELSYLGSETEMLSPSVYINSNRQATVEGCKGVIEYDRNTIRLNCARMIVKFCGDNLIIKTVSTGEISVSGVIVSVEFLT